MNYYIANIIKERLKSVSFVDNIVGLVRPITANINEKPCILPVAINISQDLCLKGNYIDLMPNSKYKSIIYFEDNGINVLECSENKCEYISKLKMIVWLNTTKINDVGCLYDGSICSTLELIKAMQKSNPINNVNTNPLVHRIIVMPKSIIRDKTIFSEYTYDEKYSQYLFYPYDYFAINIDVRFITTCLC